MAKLEGQLEQLQSENLDKAPLENETEIIQHLINARVAHAVWSHRAHTWRKICRTRGSTRTHLDPQNSDVISTTQTLF